MQNIKNVIFSMQNIKNGQYQSAFRTNINITIIHRDLSLQLSHIDTQNNYHVSLAKEYIQSISREN